MHAHQSLRDPVTLSDLAGLVLLSRDLTNTETYMPFAPLYPDSDRSS
jgi:hypothetical protein